MEFGDRCATRRTFTEWHQLSFNRIAGVSEGGIVGALGAGRDSRFAPTSDAQARSTASDSASKCLRVRVAAERVEGRGAPDVARTCTADAFAIRDTGSAVRIARRSDHHARLLTGHLYELNMQPMQHPPNVHAVSDRVAMPCYPTGAGTIQHHPRCRTWLGRLSK